MRNKKKVGLDEWKVVLTTQEFFTITKQQALELYDIRIQSDGIWFYAPIWQHYHIQHVFTHGSYIKTTGMFGYLFRSFKTPSRIIAILLSCVLWYGLSNTIFEIEIHGEQDKSRSLIQKSLQDFGYRTPFYGIDMQQIKQQVKKQLENDIAWLEIRKQGSRYFITYTPKEFASLDTLQHDELIAQEDGVIAQFDIAHGNKVKKVNDYVHVGDVLVSNVLEDSTGKKEEVYVDGRVYAYTWKDVIVTMDKTSMPKSFQYFEMLLQARSDVAKDFKEGDRIYKENILQFSTDMGKIKMVIHYTLYKDITTP